jgi:hypothetical protein
MENIALSTCFAASGNTIYRIGLVSFSVCIDFSKECACAFYLGASKAFFDCVREALFAQRFSHTYLL